MNKIIFSGFMASIMMASSAALADEAASSLTTKNYVDSGLRAVYSTASSAATDATTALGQIETLSGTTDGLVTDVSGLQGTVGNSESGLVHDVNALETVVGNSESGLVQRVDQLEATSRVYSAGDGITINNNGVVGINGAAETEEGKMYVYKDGALSAMPVEDTWDASIFTQQ